MFGSRKWLIQKRDALLGPTLKTLDKTLMLTGVGLSQKMSKLNTINDLSEVEYSVFSQWGEDGIISWLIDKLGDMPRSFVEFGVENYQESNTRFLLKSRNWSGLIIDGDVSNVEHIQQDDIYWRHDLTAVRSFITTSNINETFERYKFTGEVGILSIDIDGNDYWIWKEIENVSPVLLVIEYNAVLGDTHQLTVPYCPDFTRNKHHHSNLYFGASIRALTSLSKQKGYTFVGTNSNGVNAFYVRNDYVSKIHKAVQNTHAYPSKFRESRDKKGNLNYLAAANRSMEIGECVVINTGTPGLQETKISEIKDIYSNEWIAGQKSIF